MSHCDVAHIHYRRHAVDPRVLARKVDLVLSTQFIDFTPEPIRACSTSSGSEKTCFPRLILIYEVIALSRLLGKNKRIITAS
jgi:hypothetical protein